MKLLLRLAISLFVMWSCVSCSKKATEDSDYNIFKYNEAAGVLTLDPIYAKDLPHIWACNQLYNSLLSFDDSMRIVPMLAKSWDVSQDGKRYVFYLRNDVYFHDNEVFDTPRQMTAYDVAYSFNRVVDTKLNSPGAWIFSMVRQDSAGYCFRALNDSVFAVELDHPFPPFLGILTMTYTSVIPKEAVEYYGDDFRRNPVGTGPFRFQYWKEGVRLVMRKNPNYFEIEDGERLPYLDAVSVSFLIDKQVAFLEFVKGKFDFMSGVDARYKDELLSHEGTLRAKYHDKIYIMREPYLNTEYLSFSLESQDSLGDDRSRVLRRAVSYAIDRDKMLRFLRNGVGKPACGGMIPIGLAGHRDDIGYNFDPQLARSLIGSQGLDGFPLMLSTTAEYADIGKFVQSQLVDVGLDCRMEILPPATLRSLRANGSLSFFRSSWVADYPDAENYMSLFTSDNFSPQGPNYTHYANARYDSLYVEAMRSTDQSHITRCYEAMDSLMMQEAPVVVLFYDEVLRFVNKRISGLGSNPVNLLDLRRVKKKTES